METSAGIVRKYKQGISALSVRGGESPMLPQSILSAPTLIISDRLPHLQFDYFNEAGA
jgi:hypothetical protein